MARRSAPRWQHRALPQGLLARLIAAYIRLVDRTGRWQLRCDPAAADLIRSRRPFIGAFWHGRLLMIYPAWRAALAALGVSDPLQPYVMISGHGDGMLIAHTTARFGLRAVHGSSRRGGATALRAAHQLLGAGHILVLAPDGPRGPRWQVKPGIVQLARRSGAPIVPIAFAASNERLLDSWDRFALVLPFARGVLAFGAPLTLGRDADPETARLLVEERLSALTAEADLILEQGRPERAT